MKLLVEVDANTITYECLTEIIVEELKKDYDTNLTKDYELIIAIDKVLGYYLNKTEYQDWVDTRRKVSQLAYEDEGN